MVVVDTSVWVDWFAGVTTPQVEYLDACLETGDEELALTDVVLTEVLQGLRSGRDVRRVESRFAPFPVLRLAELDDFRRAADLYRRARSKGVAVRKTLDCLIASVCVRDDARILHCDRDFDNLSSVTPLRTVMNAGGSS